MKQNYLVFVIGSVILFAFLMVGDFGGKFNKAPIDAVYTALTPVPSPEAKGLQLRMMQYKKSPFSQNNSTIPTATPTPTLPN